MKPDTKSSELALNLWAYIDRSSGMAYSISGRPYAPFGTDQEKAAHSR